MNAPAAQVGPAARLARLLGIESSELLPVAWSFAYFFCLLAAYYMLRPVREAMAIVGGTANIPWLFTGTFVVMLVIATPAFGWVTSRYPRRRFLPWVYYFFIVNIALFYAGFLLLAGSGTPEVWLSRAFFVWLSVFNLFVVSVFWSFMADIWNREQGRRLFGVISAGGSTGALAGPLLTSVLVEPLGAHNLLPLSALLLGFAVVCVLRLRRWASGQQATPGTAPVDRSLPIGGKALAGIKLVATTPYLASIAAALMIANFLGVFIYMYMAVLVDETFSGTDRHTQVFALLDALTNALSFIGQLIVVRYSVRRIGVGLTLTILPLVSVAGFLLLALHPVFAVMAGLQVLRRSITFGLSKPTSHMLDSVVSRAAKYKAKNFVETTIYRGGDLFATWTIRYLGSLGIGISGVALVCAALAVGWIVLALKIGRDYAERDAALKQGETA